MGEPKGVGSCAVCDGICANRRTLNASDDSWPDVFGDQSVCLLVLDIRRNAAVISAQKRSGVAHLFTDYGRRFGLFFRFGFHLARAGLCLTDNLKGHPDVSLL